jgi:phosphoglycerate kinase
MIIGGAMANTFLKGMGYEVGKSLTEDKMLEDAKEIMAAALKKGVRFYLPVDCVVADRLDKQAETKIIPVQEVPRDWLIADIGPATVTLFGEALQNAKTIIWNGPMGAFEFDAFSRGTMAMVQKVADSYALTIVGGGDTDVALHKAGDFQKFSYVSTGGGAFIELLEGKKLPGILALEEWAKRNGDG